MPRPDKKRGGFNVRSSSREIQWPQIPSVNQPKSYLESFKSSASPLVKVGLAVTVFPVIMAIVVLTVLIIILFLKLSALEAAESNSSGLQNNKAIQKYCCTFDYINSKIDSFKRELNQHYITNRFRHFKLF